MLEDIVRIAPKSQSQYIHFELGLQYNAGFRWHLKEWSTEEFGWTLSTKGILEGVGSTIKREEVLEDDWESEPVLQRARRQAAKVCRKARRNPKRGGRGL